MVFKPTDKTELQTAINLWISDNTMAVSTYGDINTWDTSLIPDMITHIMAKPCTMCCWKNKVN